MTPAPANRTPLTRERIIAQALAIVDDSGVDSLSMRRLGQRLGVDPMAVYYHVPNKAALHDGMVEHLWSGVTLPTRTEGERWQDILKTVFSAFRARLLEHPRAVVLIGTRPSTTPALLRLINDALGRLETAGLAGQDAMPLIDCLSGFTIGKVLAEIGEPLGGQADTVQTALAGITPDSHPHIIRTMTSGYTLAPDEQFQRGLNALINGWA